MAHSRSTKKRIRQNRVQRTRNQSYLTRYRSTLKKAENALQNEDAETCRTLYPGFVKIIDKTASLGIIHKNQAANKKSGLAKKINSLG